jgi:hypothetical protein
MKTPSSLPLLLLFAALPAAAEPKPGQRCDVEWLEKTQTAMSQPGRVVTDERIELVGIMVNLKFGHPKTCDAATWRQLATVEPINGEVILDPKTHQPVGGTGLRWRNRAAGDFWKDTTVAQHIGLVLAVNDFYAAVDARAAEVVAAGDEVIDAAKALGFADFKASEKSLAELAKGTSGGPVGAIKPRVVTVLEAGKQAAATVAPELLGPTMRKLVNEGPTLGDSVVKFRVSVLALNAEIGRLGTTSDLLKKRVPSPTPGMTDFVSGLPKDFVAAGADKASALAEEKYGAALAALIGPGATPGFADQGLRGASLLDPIDQGLRNLIAIRSAEVDKIFSAAKARLGGKTIDQFTSGARAAAAVKTAPNALAAAVFTNLSQTPEYARLDALFENNSRKPGWADTQEGKDVIAAREAMKNAAYSAAVETIDGKKQVVFTPQGGKKIILGNMVPSSVENDPVARERVAAALSDLIVDGALTSAQTKAVVAAVTGAGQPGTPLDTGLTSAESKLGKELPVPPASKKIKDGAAGCDSPKDLVRNDYETYAARQRAAAAQLAGANVRSRNDVETARVAATTAADAACKQRKDAAAATKQTYFNGGDITEAARTKAIAAANAACASDLAAIETTASAKIAELTAKEAGASNPASLTAKADADLAAGFAVAISASIETLRKDYTTAGTPRVKKLADMTGNDPELYARTKIWFATEWPLDPSKKTELEKAVADCAKALGLGAAGNKISYKNPDNPDNVDKHCKVNEKLTQAIVAGKGSNHLAPEVK